MGRPISIGATSPITNDVGATSVTDSSATLSGRFDNPAGFTTTVWFEYGTTTSYGSITASQAYATAGGINVSATISGLSSQTTYHYRLVTQNAGGKFSGNDKSFTTLITPTTLASGLTCCSIDIAVDSTSVYWAESSTIKIKKVGINGGTPTTLASGLTCCSTSSIAVDSTSVYWTESGAIKKVGINGGTPTTLTCCSTSNNGIAVDSTSVYWTESDAIKKVAK